MSRETRNTTTEAVTTIQVRHPASHAAVTTEWAVDAHGTLRAASGRLQAIFLLIAEIEAGRDETGQILEVMSDALHVLRTEIQDCLDRAR
jgi:hypothetical protein